MDSFPVVPSVTTAASESEAPRFSVRPNVSEQEALRAFQGKGLDSMYWRFTRGPLQRLAPVYVPFRAFRVEYDHGRSHNHRLFGIDRASGILDLFEFPNLPLREHMVSVATRNCLPVRISDEQAQSSLREKVLRIIFQAGAFQAGNLNLQVQPVEEEFHMPYWLGFYGVDGALRCRVLDAVRCRMEGPKAVFLFEEWLGAR